MRTFSEKYEVRLAYHSRLNPKLWKGWELRPEVRQKLLQAAQVWEGFAKIPLGFIRDVIITGGNVNYNWTEWSDIDVHVVADRSAFGAGNLTDEYFKAKKKLWSLTHHIEVRGYPLEMYVQDPGEKAPPGQGIYSISRGVWVQKPVHGGYDFERDPELARKAEEYAGLIDHLVDTGAPVEDFRALKERIASMRSEGIAKGGEFATDNLVFKSLRNNGALDKMTRYIRDREDKELSLSETTASKLLRAARAGGKVKVKTHYSHDDRTGPNGKLKGTNFSSYANPIPRDHSSMTDHGYDRLQHAIKNRHFTFKEVPIDKIKSRQEWIRDRNVLDLHRKVVRGKELDKPSTIEHPDGTHTVLNGNHRIARDLLLGKKTTRVQAYDLHREI